MGKKKFANALDEIQGMLSGEVNPHEMTIEVNPDMGQNEPTPKFKEREAVKFIRTEEGKYTIGEPAVIDEVPPLENIGGLFFYTVKSAGRTIENVPEGDMESVYSGTEKDVDLYLREKEKKNEYQDSDIRATNTAKAKRAFKGMINLDGIDEIEASGMAKSLVKINKVYPQINTTEEIDNGVSGGTLYLKVNARRFCSDEIPDTAEARKLYIGLVEWFWELTSITKTMNEFWAACDFFRKGVIRKSFLILAPEKEPELLAEKELMEAEVAKMGEYEELKDDATIELRNIYDKLPEWTREKERVKEQLNEEENKIYEDLLIVLEENKRKYEAASTYRNSGTLPIEASLFKNHEELSSSKAELIQIILGKRFAAFIKKETYKNKPVEDVINDAVRYDPFTKDEYEQVYKDRIQPQEDSIKYLQKKIDFFSDENKPIRERIEYGCRNTNWHTVRKVEKELPVWSGKARAYVKKLKTIEISVDDNNKELSESTYPMVGWTTGGKDIRYYWSNNDIQACLRLINLALNGTASDGGWIKDKQNIEKSIEKLKEEFRVRGNDYSWVGKKKEAKKGESGIDELGGSTTEVPLSFIKRTGGVAVYDTDFDTGAKQKEFYNNILGMDSTFGASISDLKRKTYSRYFAGAILDFCETINWKVQDLAELKKKAHLPAKAPSVLHIKFATSGTRAGAAHYEPDTGEINLTDNSGAGSIWHEVTHYIDHIITKLYPQDSGTVKNYAPMASYIKTKNVSNAAIYNAMYDLMNFIVGGVKFNPQTKEVIIDEEKKPLFEPMLPMLTEFVQSMLSSVMVVNVEANEKSKEWGERYKLHSTIEEDMAALKLSHPDYFLYSYYELGGAKNYAKKNIEGLIACWGLKNYPVTFSNSKEKQFYTPKWGHGTIYQETNVKLAFTGTQYYTRSKAVGKDYWTLYWELLARASECYGADKMVKFGRYNNYLVSGGKFGNHAGVYPSGIERQIIYILMDNLYAVIKKELEIGDFIPFREERADEYVELITEKEEDEKEPIVLDEAPKASLQVVTAPEGEVVSVEVEKDGKVNLDIEVGQVWQKKEKTGYKFIISKIEDGIVYFVRDNEKNEPINYLERPISSFKDSYEFVTDSMKESDVEEAPSVKLLEFKTKDNEYFVTTNGTRIMIQPYLPAGVSGKRINITDIKDADIDKKLKEEILKKLSAIKDSEKESEKKLNDLHEWERVNKPASITWWFMPQEDNRAKPYGFSIKGEKGDVLMKVPRISEEQLKDQLFDIADKIIAQEGANEKVGDTQYGEFKWNSFEEPATVHNFVLNTNKIVHTLMLERKIKDEVATNAEREEYETTIAQRDAFIDSLDQSQQDFVMSNYTVLFNPVNKLMYFKELLEKEIANKKVFAIGGRIDDGNDLIQKIAAASKNKPALITVK